MNKTDYLKYLREKVKVRMNELKRNKEHLIKCCNICVKMCTPRCKINDSCGSYPKDWDIHTNYCNMFEAFPYEAHAACPGPVNCPYPKSMEPQLGCATTGQLLDELKARIEVSGLLEYRTIDS
jgi:hypothetical protein